MRSPEFLRNGEVQVSPRGGGQTSSGARRRGGGVGVGGFQSTVSLQKLRRFNTILLALRVAAFCFLLAATIFMAMNSHGSFSTRWFDYDSFRSSLFLSLPPSLCDCERCRYMVAANAIVGVYSFFEMGAALWEMLNGSTIMPETIQLWFDFTHDQAFAYLLFSANSSATTLTQNLRSNQVCPGFNAPCAGTSAFCIQSYLALAFGFAGFLFLAASAVLSGFRVACFVITGSRNSNSTLNFYLQVHPCPFLSQAVYADKLFKGSI
ncbi:CASP-like protein 4C2 [Nymphaea thermarum]|nr:CASP-like protein 4C2 [Nymphaea thermarum]